CTRVRRDYGNVGFFGFGSW
nr:immunoglobulin heavy chain junction region [Macaca mulatta]MOW32436.1 immunoglobulin heavy chain junction region [Macaca mulatta]MOW32469.1 immunoglobulin heavy chain junction region [Macaca mulatta]MOW32671.1 immunoglobulin heavy chain junction region [Macaca mulatta]MOW32776.1 immunoglobulin heavy chain junction region [Macaca mulatta]